MSWRAYSYRCGLTRVSDNNFRDEVAQEYQRQSFAETAERFAQALWDVLECGDLLLTVFDMLSGLATAIHDLLIFRLSPPQWEALKLRLLFGPEARAAFAVA